MHVSPSAADILELMAVMAIAPASSTTMRTDSVNDDIRETVAPLIDAVSKAWDQMVRQVDEVLRWSPGQAPGERASPAVMADGELREALLAIAFSLIDAIDPVRLASIPAAGDPRWRFNLPATVETHVRDMFTEASHAFSLAVIGLRDHASLADLTAVGRLADILARARWLLEPSEEPLRRERGYALTADAIAWFRAMSDRSAEAGGADQRDLPGEIADRAATMETRLAELMQEDGLKAVRVPKRRKLFETYLPGSGLTLYALSSAAASRPGSAPSALFYAEPGTGNALYNFQRLHLTRAYWLAQAVALYADFCDAAAPVLGQQDWEEIIATAEARLRPLGEEADLRYQQRLHRGIHPGL
jgi:hypothetical protein